MSAVSTVDTVGGLLIAIGAAVWLIVDGVLDRAGAGSTPSSRTDTRQAPGCRPLPVEPGTFSPADIPHRKDETTRQSNTSAGEAIEALTFPGPYSRIGNLR